MRITQGPQGEIGIWREPQDKRVYRDSTLMNTAARVLRAKGLDVIRKDAGKDGNLTSVGNWYLRDRKNRFCWHFPHYQLRAAYQDFNQDGKVFLLAIGDWPVIDPVIN